MCITAVMLISTNSEICGKRLRHLVSGFAPVNERIATIRIREKLYNISQAGRYLWPHCWRVQPAREHYLKWYEAFRFHRGA